MLKYESEIPYLDLLFKLYIGIRSSCISIVAERNLEDNFKEHDVRAY